MGKKPRGLKAGKTLKKRRHKSRWMDTAYKKRALNLKKKPPLMKRKGL